MGQGQETMTGSLLSPAEPTLVSIPHLEITRFSEVHHSLQYLVSKNEHFLDFATG